MAKSQTLGEIKQQIDRLFGRQPENYIIRLVNDALLDITDKKQHYTVSATADLIKGQRWYDLPTRTIDIIKVEILDTSTNSRYNLIPKLVDYHSLLKGDPDTGTGDLT